MRLKDLHLLPKFRDSLSYLYVEHCKVEQDEKAIALWDAQGKVPVPCAGLTVLMLGPGVSITHAAVATLADNGCLVLWCGEEGVRLYAQGLGLTRSAGYFLHQARLWAHPDTRLQVVFRLYRMRFAEPLEDSLTLQQIRGREGVRVREAYARASRETGVPWHGRAYRRDAFRRTFFLKTIVRDLQTLLNLESQEAAATLERFHRDQALPGELWDPEVAAGLPGGQNFAPDPDEEGGE